MSSYASLLDDDDDAPILPPAQQTSRHNNNNNANLQSGFQTLNLGTTSTSSNSTGYNANPSTTVGGGGGGYHQDSSAGGPVMDDEPLEWTRDGIAAPTQSSNRTQSTSSNVPRNISTTSAGKPRTQTSPTSQNRHPQSTPSNYPPPARAPQEMSYMVNIPPDFLVINHAQPLQYSSLPPNIRQGTLDIIVKDASLVKNYGLTRMDPFAVIELGRSQASTETHENGGRNPVWNQRMQFPLNIGDQVLHIRILDEGVAADKQIAAVSIDLQEVFDRHVVERAFPLRGRQGDEGVISLKLAFYPNVLPMPAAQRMPQQTLGYGAPGILAPGPVMPMQYPMMDSRPPAAIPQPAQPLVGTDQLDADVKTIQEMFPSMDVEIIRSVLVSKGANMDATVTALLEMC